MTRLCPNDKMYCRFGIVSDPSDKLTKKRKKSMIYDHIFTVPFVPLRTLLAALRMDLVGSPCDRKWEKTGVVSSLMCLVPGAAQAQRFIVLVSAVCLENGGWL